MKIIKPNSNKHALDLEPDDEFFSHSHGLGLQEHTLCSVAPEEWGYDDFTPKKRITCGNCLDLIRHCREYKL